MTLSIPDNDHGKIRVFAVAEPHKDLIEKTPESLLATFGTNALNIDFVDVLDVEELGEELDLLDYIAEGYDVAVDEGDMAVLSRQTGIVVFIMSRAHEGVALDLTLGDGVRQLTTLGRGARMTVAARIDTEASDGVIGAPDAKPAKSDARVGGMVATIALVLMFALVGLMVWVGG